MKYFNYIIQNPTGLHARPVSNLIATAWTWQFEVTLEEGEKTANPRSLMSVPVSNINQDGTIRITATGVDEREAVTGMEESVKKNL